MRLIDADALIVFVEKWLSKECDEDGKTIPNIWIDSLKKCIDNQQTAYDVKKVVDQLKKESYQEFCDSPKIVDLKDAIEIVKGGGVDE